jgi:hypothetical protein
MQSLRRDRNKVLEGSKERLTERIRISFIKAGREAKN